MKILEYNILTTILICSTESSNFKNIGSPECGRVPISSKPKKLTKIPWTANLYLQTETQPDKTFAALIVSPTMIILKSNLLLSDAKDYKLHLFPNEFYEVRTNITKFAEAKSYNPNVQSSKITHIRMHPNYNRKHWTEGENDVAIVHLQEPITFDSQVHSVCLPTMTEMGEILKIWTNSSAFVFISGWKRHEQDGTVLRMTPMEQVDCKHWWENHWETKHAKYSNRICANVSTENSHTSCVNSFGDIGTFLRMHDRFYFAGFVNNLYSDKRVCNSKTRYFISYNTPQILQFIENNTRCGPYHFTCSNGDCIPLENSMCNRTSECSDGSDEDPHYCRGLNYCSLNQFACGVYGKCIEKDKLCNGEYDCENNEDEENCPTIYVTVLLAVAGVGILVLIFLAIIFWRKMRMAQEKLRNLTDEEVNEFEYGIPSSTSLQLENHLAVNFAWNKHRFEIPRDQLKIEWSSVLGSGATGKVYNCVYNKGNENIDVAVKTFKSTSDVEILKALLSELKIMTKVGSHENIVNLIGAYTREIKKRILYIVVEFCPLGSLEHYLRDNRPNFIDLFNLMTFPEPHNGYVKYAGNVSNPNTHIFTTEDLLRWSYQIANGTEHLSSINVVHGDLATRNVLLTKQLNAKISDFGLSHNLYESGIYVSKHQVPLPWKWMAVESLRDLEFSSRSDVCSYGITLWEIFSLGGVPYPGLNWTAEFLLKLYQGLRMNQPSFANKEIYDQMLRCWHQDPSQRPEFNALKEFFHEMFLNFHRQNTQENHVVTSL